MRTTRGVRFPVELASRQPFDDFPQRTGASRTNRFALKYGPCSRTGQWKTGGLFYLSPAFILFCCTAST
ncbi:hypothetical protein MKC38_10440 [[Clostridium] innocuum]|nr:hypothetical protein [[Clostridium] innocuum]